MSAKTCTVCSRKFNGEHAHSALGGHMRTHSKYRFTSVDRLKAAVARRNKKVEKTEDHHPDNFINFIKDQMSAGGLKPQRERFGDSCCVKVYSSRNPNAAVYEAEVLTAAINIIEVIRSMLNQSFKKTPSLKVM